MKPRQQSWAAYACALCLLQAAACSSEERPRAEPSPEPPAPPAAAAPAPTLEAPAEAAPEAPANAEPTAEELPVSEDFESEAEQQITAKNFREELAKLEKEIPAEQPPGTVTPAAPAPTQAPAQKKAAQQKAAQQPK
jgi:hypothetical protein